MLELRGVSFSYKQTRALSDIDLIVSEGEFLGIIGPNGAGKSTLLRLMSKALRPSSGSILIGGRPLEQIGWRELAREMAFVSAEVYFDFPFTVLEVVLMGRTPHLGRFAVEGRRDLEIARRALRLTGAGHLEERIISQLSSGERQRALIAQALAQQPRILLLDEPTAHLDIKHEIEIFELLRALNRQQNLTIIAALHDLNLAAEYCHRLLLLAGGRIYKLGSPAEVLDERAIAEAYGASVLVAENPATGARHVYLVTGGPEGGAGGL